MRAVLPRGTVTGMGVDVSALHRLVPAAEELDLLEQHEEAAVLEEHAAVYEEADRIWGDELHLPDAGPSSEDPAEPDEGWTANHASAVAYVLHELGGRLKEAE